VSDRQPCRVCGKRAYVRQDGTVSPHNAGGQTCTGSMRPPEGETPCTLYCPTVGTVSWPEDLDGDGPMASTTVCANPEHRDEAERWVEQATGHRGVFVPFKRAGVAR
jgi:hypothetical protein